MLDILFFLITEYLNKIVAQYHNRKYAIKNRPNRNLYLGE